MHFDCIERLWDVYQAYRKAPVLGGGERNSGMSGSGRFQPYFIDWSDESVKRVRAEYDQFKREPAKMAWECGHCGTLNESAVIEGCVSCGASRSSAHLRAIWGS